MGGGSSSKSSSSSKTTYSKTTTSNPYVTSVTDNNGTTTSLKEGTAYKSIYDYLNKNMNSLLEEYRNPSINSPTSQALLQNYTKTLDDESKKSLENSIINPLAQRNMLRSSAATNLYSDLSKNISDNISNYTAQLLANSQRNTGDMITLLTNAYLQGQNAVNGNQALSLSTSSGNATTEGTGSSKSYSYGM
jgi:hypothetical protein